MCRASVIFVGFAAALMLFAGGTIHAEEETNRTTFGVIVGALTPSAEDPPTEAPFDPYAAPPPAPYATSGTCYAYPTTSYPSTNGLEGKVNVSLEDGSELVGEVSGLDVIAVETEFGLLNVPRKKVGRIDFNRDGKRVRVTLKNGDRVTGTMSRGPLTIEWALGKTELPREKVIAISQLYPSRPMRPAWSPVAPPITFAPDEPPTIVPAAPSPIPPTGPSTTPPSPVPEPRLY
jgi:small nuclear ribonucleoprotein (snRNP)-like protein